MLRSFARSWPEVVGRALPVNAPATSGSRGECVETGRRELFGMRILYLYEEVMGYTVATLRSLTALGAEVHVVHWDHRKLTPYRIPLLPDIHTYARSELSAGGMQRLADEIAPAITVVSGWTDRGYLRVSRTLRSRHAPVVVALDGHWRGGARQRVASLLGSAGFLRRYFSHAWVTGAYQFEYARRLGFDKDRIIFDLYSADLTLFLQAFEERVASRRAEYPRRFLFIGRMEPIKGLDTLREAWRLLGDGRRGWELQLIGNGSLRAGLDVGEDVVVREFLQPGELAREVADAGCFVLPSRSEPWGVVVHECAAAGLPLILSDVVGAGTTFLIPGMNGYRFRADDPRDLASRMASITAATDDELRTMSRHSHRISQRITPESSAANLWSLAVT
jgi:glycosyltransferase involved in cell wall biosynthesis